MHISQFTKIQSTYKFVRNISDALIPLSFDFVQFPPRSLKMTVNTENSEEPPLLATSLPILVFVLPTPSSPLAFAQSWLLA